MTRPATHSKGAMKQLQATTSSDDPNHQALAFLTALFGTIRRSHVVCSGQNDDNHWRDSFASADLTKPNSLTILAETVTDLSHNRQWDIYVATSTMAGTRRAGSNAVATPALWTEFDYAESSETKTYTPWTDREEIDAFIDTHIGIRPSIQIESGNGLHCWWLLEEPLTWWDNATAQNSEAIISRWEQWLHQRANSIGRGLDTVGDLGRVLRVPGTLNHKRGNRSPVTIAHIDPDLRYSANDIDDLIPPEHAGRTLRHATNTSSGHTDGRFVTSDDIADYLDSYGNQWDPNKAGETHVAATATKLKAPTGGRHHALIDALSTLIQPRWRNRIPLNAVLHEWSNLFDTIKPPEQQTLNEFNKAVRDITRRRITEERHIEEAKQREEARSRRITDTIPYDPDAPVTYQPDPNPAASSAASSPVTQMTGTATSSSDGYEGWTATDLETLAHTNLDPEQPATLTRRDGKHLLYTGRRNVIFGQPESGKTWVALHTVTQIITATPDETNIVAVWIDYEDTDKTFLRRLQTLGIDPHHAAQRTRWYPASLGIPPKGIFPFDTDTVKVVVVDSWNESMVAHGLQPLDAQETMRYRQQFLEGLVGLFPHASHIAIDHTPKHNESTQYGSYAKRSGLDGAAIQVSVVEQMAPGKRGAVRLTVDKDRQGGVREHAESDGYVGMFVMEPVVGDFVFGSHRRVSAMVVEPSGDSVGGKLRQAIVKVLLADVDRRGLSKKQIRDSVRNHGVKARNAVVGEMVDRMQEEGRVVGVPKGNSIAFTLPSTTEDTVGTVVREDGDYSHESPETCPQVGDSPPNTPVPESGTAPPSGQAETAQPQGLETCPQNGDRAGQAQPDTLSPVPPPKGDRAGQGGTASNLGTTEPTKNLEETAKAALEEAARAAAEQANTDLGIGDPTP